MRFIPFVQNNLTIAYRKTVVCYCLSVSKYITTWAGKQEEKVWERRLSFMKAHYNGAGAVSKFMMVAANEIFFLLEKQ